MYKGLLRRFCASPQAASGPQRAVRVARSARRAPRRAAGAAAGGRRARGGTPWELHAGDRLRLGAFSAIEGYSSTYLDMEFANVRAGTKTRRAVLGYPPEL